MSRSRARAPLGACRSLGYSTGVALQVGVYTMAFKIELATDSAAFSDETGGDLAVELAGILAGIAERFREGSYSVNAEVPVRDTNGNRVGFWKLTTD